MFCTTPVGEDRSTARSTCDIELIGDGECMHRAPAGLNGLDVGSSFRVAGHKWGSEIDDLLALNDGQRYDVLVLADTVYASGQGHIDQISSICGLLARPEHNSPGGKALVIWSSCAQQDSAVGEFFALAEQQGLVSEQQPVGRIEAAEVQARILRWK